MNNVPFGIRKEDILQHTEMDTRVRRFMTPRRILWQSEGVTGAENMLVPAEKQVHFNVPQVMTLQSKDAPASVLLDLAWNFTETLNCI